MYSVFVSLEYFNKAYIRMSTLSGTFIVTWITVNYVLTTPDLGLIVLVSGENVYSLVTLYAYRLLC